MEQLFLTSWVLGCWGHSV